MASYSSPMVKNQGQWGTDKDIFGAQEQALSVHFKSFALFLPKLYKCLSVLKKKGLTDVILYQPDGSLFKVHKQDKICDGHPPPNLLWAHQFILSSNKLTHTALQNP